MHDNLFEPRSSFEPDRSAGGVSLCVCVRVSVWLKLLRLHVTQYIRCKSAQQCACLRLQPSLALKQCIVHIRTCLIYAIDVQQHVRAIDHPLSQIVCLWFRCRLCGRACEWLGWGLWWCVRVLGLWLNGWCLASGDGYRDGCVCVVQAATANRFLHGTNSWLEHTKELS